MGRGSLRKEYRVIRNAKLLEWVRNIPEIQFEYLGKNQVQQSQYGTVEYKQILAVHRLQKPLWSRKNIKSQFVRYKFFSFFLRFYIVNLGIRFPKRYFLQ